MPANAVRNLRELLSTQFPDAIPVPRHSLEAVATGIEVLDSILPNGGFPKGRLSVWLPMGGATSILRATCLSAVRRGERVAWIDGGGTIASPFWTVGPMLVRPTSRPNALRATEALLRSGAFSLVVLAGVDPEGIENVRLSRAAHDGGVAAVALTKSATRASLKISSSIEPQSYVWRRDPHGEPAAIDGAILHVRVTSLGWNRRTRIAVPVLRYELLVTRNPILPDRRGTRRSIHR